MTITIFLFLLSQKNTVRKGKLLLMGTWHYTHCLQGIWTIIFCQPTQLQVCYLYQVTADDLRLSSRRTEKSVPSKLADNPISLLSVSRHNPFIWRFSFALALLFLCMQSPKAVHHSVQCQTVPDSHEGTQQACRGLFPKHVIEGSD